MLLPAALLVGLLAAGGVTAQETAPATPQSQGSPSPAKINEAPPPAPLSASERSALQELFTKARLATLRIEECRVNTCTEPDGVGTGFLIGPDGLALTAYHVVFNAKNLVARTADGEKYSLSVVGFDDQNDLAVLRVNVPGGTPYLPLASARPAAGDAVLAIGNGGGAFLTPKTGRLLALNADAGRADFASGTLELNAQLIPGDSGGPILNTRGEVTGVVSYINVSQGTYTRRGGYSGIVSYAVPVTADDPRLADLKAGTRREAPQIGIGLSSDLSILTRLPADLFKLLNEKLGWNMGDTPGAFFTSVVPGSPAAAAGLRPSTFDSQQGILKAGDIVTAVNDKKIANFSDFQYAVRSYATGDTVSLSVIRDGQPITVKLTLAPRSKIQN